MLRTVSFFEDDHTLLPVDTMCQLLQTKTFIHRVSFSNDIWSNNDHFARVLDSISRNSSIHSISFYDLRLRPSNICTLFDFVERNTQLNTLKLSHVLNIGALPQLFELISRNTRLRELSLNDNKCIQSNIDGLMVAVSKNTGLKKLDLSDLEISGKDTVRSMISVLELKMGLTIDVTNMSTYGMLHPRLKIYRRYRYDDY
jgi:hypothetical protein